MTKSFMDRLRGSGPDTPLSLFVEKICSFPDRKARSLVNTAVLRGILVRPAACASCGAVGKVEGHHSNYFRPFDVSWLCCACHNAEHTRLYQAGIVIPGALKPRYGSAHLFAEQSSPSSEVG